MGSSINTSRRLGVGGKGMRLFSSPQWLLFSVVSFAVLRSAMSDDIPSWDYDYNIVLYIVAGASVLLIMGGLYICFRPNLEMFGITRRSPIPDDLLACEGDVDAVSSAATFCVAFPNEMGGLPGDVETGGSTKTGETSDTTPEPPKEPPTTVACPSHESMEQSNHTGSAAGMAAAGTAGLAIAGTMAVGWNVVGLLAENLPWIGVAYNLLNEIVEIVDTKNGMKGNMAKIRKWAVSLQDVIVSMGKQMKKHPAANARALQNMSRDVISELQELVNVVVSYDQRGTLAQYAASRSCQKAVDAADTALRGALTKLAVGQGAEIMTMVGNLQAAGLVVDEKLDMIIEHLRKQEEHTARLELRLAEYSESIAEVLGNMALRKGQQPPTPGKNLRELGKETLDKLQISKNDITYPSNMPFASGTFSEVYQVVHEGVVKAAKKTNLARLGVGRHGVDRVFKRFVKELYILSQMHSERVVSVYGAIASPTELTLIMEFLERGSLRSILDDDKQRAMMTPDVKHGILEDTAGGMTYLYHMGVEHRDLKSANCLVTHDWRVKITDFGLSRTTDAISTGSASTVSSVFRGGTMVYMAPELLPGGTGADRRITAELSDVYSFGIITWEVLCGEGRMPWNSERLDTLPLTLKMGKKLDIPQDCSHFYRKIMMNCWRAEPHRRPTFKRILKVLRKNPRGGVDQPQSPSPARPFPLNLPTRRKSLPPAEFSHIGLPALEDPSSSDGDEATGGSTSSSHPHRNTPSSSLERVRPRHRNVLRTPTRRHHHLPERHSRSPVDRSSKPRETPSRSPAGKKKERDRRTPSRSPIGRKRRDDISRPGAPLRSPAHRRGDTRETPSRARVDIKEWSHHPDDTPGGLEQPPSHDLGNARCLEICPPAGSNRKAHARRGSAPAATTGKEYPIIIKGMKRRSASTSGVKRYSSEGNGGGVKAIPESRLPSTTWAPIPIVMATTPQLLPALSETEGDAAAGHSAWNWKKSLTTSAEEIGSPVKSTSTAPTSDPQVPDNEEVASGTGSLVVNGVVDTTPSTESKKTPGRQRRDILPDNLTTPSGTVMPVTFPGISVESTESESVVENRGLGAPHDASLQPQSPLKGSDALAAWLYGTSKNSNPGRRRTARWRGEIVELPPSVEHPVKNRKGDDEEETRTDVECLRYSGEASLNEEAYRSQSLNVTGSAGRNRGLCSQPGIKCVVVETYPGRRSASMDESVITNNGEEEVAAGNGKMEDRWSSFLKNATPGRVRDKKATNDRKGSSGEGKVKKRPPSVEFVHGFRPIDTSDR